MCKPAFRCAIFVWILLCHNVQQYRQQYYDAYEEEGSYEIELPQPIIEMTCNRDSSMDVEGQDGYGYERRHLIVIQCNSASEVSLSRNYHRIYEHYGQSPDKLQFINSNINKISNGLFLNGINGVTVLSFTDVNLRQLETNSLSHFINLRELELNRNKLESLQPGSLNGLQSLERLDASDNMLSGFIDKRNFTGIGLKLYYLDLSFNNISFIRRNCFYEFKNLVTFNISHNSLTVLSKLFQYNTLLININLAYNKISEIGNDTFPSSKINLLDLSFNNLSEVLTNSFVGKFLTNRAISTFRLNDNYLESFPEILNTVSVHELSISNNNITEIPSGHFCVSLKVSHMNLKILTNISMCNTGTILTASHNNLQEIPLWRDMQAVEIVELQYNNISDIPLGTFSQLTNLTILRLDKNILMELDTGAFSGLENLVRLNISFNKLRSIDHHVLYGLTELQELYLGGNHLTTLPYDDIFAGLHSLKMIGLNNNHWNCFNLMKILQAMGLRKIKITHHGHVDYHVTNLGGVRCWNDKNYVNTTEDYSRTTVGPVTYTSRLMTRLTSLSTEPIWTKQTNKATTPTTKLPTTTTTRQAMETTNPSKGVRTSNTAELLNVTNTSSEISTTVLPKKLAPFSPKEHMEERIVQEKLQQNLNPVNELIKANDEKYDKKLQAVHGSIYEIKNIFIIIVLLLCCLICIKFYKFFKNNIKMRSHIVTPSTSRQNFANEIEM